jgi:serine/threonine-protein kinase
MSESAAFPATFGPYRALRVIGRGGAALVVEAVHESSGQRVAIKALTGTHADQPVLIARFEREARIIAHLRHPHVVRAHEVGSADGRPYLVMEMLDGETLAMRLARSVRLDLPEIAGVFLPVCTAVAAAHAAGIIHRDLKPSNVMLARAPSGIVPKVLDFGISKITGSADADASHGGGVLGTMRYLAPETVCSGIVGASSDVYALGLMLFECATGRGPFGSTGYDVVQALLTDRPLPAPRSIAPELPALFEAVILRALRRDPGVRFATALDLAKGLLPFAPPATRGAWAHALAVAEGPVRGSQRPAPAAASIAPPRPSASPSAPSLPPHPAATSRRLRRYGAAIFSRSFWTMLA